MKQLFTLLIATFILSLSANAQRYTLDSFDVRTGLGPSNPSMFTPFGNKLYFFATDIVNFDVMFETDGVTAPSLVGNPSSTPKSGNNAVGKAAVELGGIMYYSASLSATGRELYKYDGVSQQVLELDVEPGTTGSNPQNLTVFNNKIYFTTKVSGIVGIMEYDPNTKILRKLTDKYPDTNSGAQHADYHFREIQEAYVVLSDGKARKQYDNDRWLAGMSSRIKNVPTVTPESILKEAINLHQHMGTVDAWRMSHQKLHDYIFQLLDETNTRILFDADSDAYRESVVEQVLGATRVLKYELMLPVSEKLIELAEGNNDQLIDIHMALAKRKKQARWQKWMPFFIIGITTLLTIAMFSWGGN